MSKSLSEYIRETVAYVDEDDQEWTIGEIGDDLDYKIVHRITEHLNSLKRPIPKKLVFGDKEAVDNSIFNKCIDELVMDIEEGKL